MDTLTIESLIKLIGAYPVNEGKINHKKIINRVLTQSIYASEGTAVIAARWYSVDNTIQEALKKGAEIVFCPESFAKKYNNPKVMAVKDPLDSVERFEKWCERDCYAKRITITGSVGKTTTTGLINTIISNKYNTLTRHSMSNSHGAILRGFQDLDKKHEYWVQEVGGVQPHYIESSAYMMHSDLVVLTNIGVSHLDKYLTQEAIFDDKSSLERYSKLNAKVIINADDPILNSAKYNHEVIRFSLNSRDCDYYGENITTSNEGMEFDILCHDGTYHVKTNLFGDYNAYNVLAAFAAGRWAGIPAEEVISLVAKYKPDGMRQNMLDIGGHKMLVDCFNAEPKTVLGSAETLSKIKLHGSGRKIFITGHIDKLGINSVEMHKALADDMEKLDIDIMCFFAGDSKYTYEKLKEKGLKNIYYFDERNKLDDWIRENINTNDVVFYKSGQFKAALAKTIDNVYGTRFQNEQQGNEGTIEVDGDFSFRLRQDNIVEIAGYKGSGKAIEIPAGYKEGNVIRIGVGAFRRNSHIESVKMPDTIMNIGQEAFYCCTGLKNITFSSNLKYIHRSAFNYCKKLKRAELPYGMLHIEMRAFKDCSDLREIVIPKTVGFIGEETFSGCDNLQILCEKDSYAEQYAKANNIKYKTISI